MSIDIYPQVADRHPLELWAEQLCGRADYEPMIPVAQKLVDEGIATGNRSLGVRGYLLLCHGHSEQGNYDRALAYLIESVNLCRPINDPTLSLKLELRYAALLAKHASLEEACERFNAVLLAKSVELERSGERAFLLQHLGHAYLWMRQYAHATKVYRLLEEESQGLDGSNTEAIALLGQAQIAVERVWETRERALLSGEPYLRGQNPRLHTLSSKEEERLYALFEQARSLAPLDKSLMMEIDAAQARYCACSGEYDWTLQIATLLAETARVNANTLLSSFCALTKAFVFLCTGRPESAVKEILLLPWSHQGMRHINNELCSHAILASAFQQMGSLQCAVEEREHIWQISQRSPARMRVTGQPPALGNAPSHIEDSLRSESKSPMTVTDSLEDFVRKHLSANLSMTVLAKFLNLKVRKMQIFFRQEKGMAPSVWIASIRIEEARLLLSSGATNSTTVKQVASRVGIPRLGTFGRLYVQRFGELPSQTLRRSRRSM